MGWASYCMQGLAKQRTTFGDMRQVSPDRAMAPPAHAHALSQQLLHSACPIQLAERRLRFRDEACPEGTEPNLQHHVCNMSGHISRLSLRWKYRAQTEAGLLLKHGSTDSCKT